MLCGGLGTRLRASFDGPKPLVPVHGRPFLELLLDFATAQGVRRFILCVGYKGELIERQFRSNEQREIVISREPQPLGTGGALKHCGPLRKAPLSIVMNGDSICPLDVAALLDFHVRHRSNATIAVAAAPERNDVGNVVINEDGRIVAFAEKAQAAGERFVNAGIYVVDESMIRDIPETVPCSLERDVFPALVPRGLYGFVSRAPLFDIGTPERLEAFREQWKRSK